MKLVDVSDMADLEAKLEKRWLRIAIAAPSGGGKTVSALRLATGIASVSGGDVRVIDTQNKQSADNAGRFKFRLFDFKPPFHPLRFLSAMQRAVEIGNRVIIVDSMSDEHEGEGGVRDLQWEAETRLHQEGCERAQRNGWQHPDREKFNQSAWAEAKENRRKLVLGLPFIEAHVIFCFRAQKQSAAFADKPRKGERPPPKDDSDGWRPIAGDKLFWDMPLRMLLLPMAKGVPTWNPVAEAERTYIRRPDHFDALLARFDGKQICEEMGAEMARWAQGDSVAQAPPGQAREPTPPRKTGAELHRDLMTNIGAATTHADLDAYRDEALALHEAKRFTKATYDGLLAAIESKRATLAEGA